jgi:HEAT repeat protein
VLVSLLLLLGAALASPQPESFGSDDPRLRAQAYRALGDAGEAASLEVLARQITHEQDPAARAAARDAMARLRLSEVQLQEALRTAEVPVARAWAAHSLGRYPGVSTVRVLMEAVEDPEPAVRREVYESLGALGDRTAFNTLMGAASRDPSLALRSVAEQATLTLVRKDHRRTDVPTQLALLQSGTVEQQVSAAAALAQAGDWRAVQPLVHAATTGPEPLALAALTALGELGDLRAVPALVKQVEDRNGSIRYHAIAALAKLGDESSLAVMEDLFSDADPLARQFAVRALFWMKAPGVAQRVAPLLKDPDERVRTEMMLGLASTDPTERAPLLKQAMKDPSPFLRSEAARLLADQRDPETIEALLHALKDRDPLVRIVAAHSLASQGESRAVAPLEKLVARTRPDEEKAAYQKALEQLR